jgi:hypothetical protein
MQLIWHGMLPRETLMACPYPLACHSMHRAAAATWRARRDIDEVHPAWKGDPRVFIPIEEDPYAQKYQQASDGANLIDMDIPASNK